MEERGGGDAEGSVSAPAIHQGSDGMTERLNLRKRADEMKDLAASLAAEMAAERDPAKKRALNQRRKIARYVEKWCRSRNGYV